MPFLTLRKKQKLDKKQTYKTIKYAFYPDLEHLNNTKLGLDNMENIERKSCN